MARSFNKEGGFVDDSVPDLGSALEEALAGAHTRVDMRELRSWLAPKLGVYRAMSEADERVPTKEQIRILDRLISVLREADGLLDDGRIPSEAEAWLDLAAHRRRPNRIWGDLVDPLRTMLYEAYECAEEARQHLDTHRVNAGRPSMSRRDALFRELVEWFRSRAGISVEDACPAVSGVLRTCGISAPSDAREAQRILRGK